ncbi:Cytochrome-c peroxidase [Pedobacter cryoconitis]|uniref:Cytochrome-c peroxidase n=1 Tax=Pedobacter cryoconitis TaxID=188932 RepID=A0A127VB16_9SPHI|nr:Cytochrome-c peroxidase [Pedobacter cryoconitis]
MIVLFLFSIVILSFKEFGFEGFVKPANFPWPVYDLAKNPVTKEGFELGRMLFYEGALSRDNKISCGSCHIQSAAFTQHGHDVSHGIEDRLGSRNSPPIMNLAWNKSFFWDGGVFHLDMFPVSPITNPVEMDEKMENVLIKLRSKQEYREKFKAVYGSDEITGTQIFKALSQFMLLCISSDSKYDSVMRKTDVRFTVAEEKGYHIFLQHCNRCHQAPLFTDGSFRNNGLNNQFNPDKGRQTITLDPQDSFKFKVPSLRNLSYTVPYMHDGRFTSIDQVLDHYTKGVQDSHTLDPLLKNKGQLGIQMTAAERLSLKTFLKTLDDKHFITRTDLSEQ